MLFLETPIISAERWKPRPESTPRSALVTTIAVNMLRMTPTESRTANPRTEPLLRAKRMKAVIRVVMLPSRIALKPFS